MQQGDPSPMAPGAADDQRLQVIRGVPTLAPPLEADMSGSLDRTSGLGACPKATPRRDRGGCHRGLRRDLERRRNCPLLPIEGYGPATASSATATPSDSKSSPFNAVDGKRSRVHIPADSPGSGNGNGNWQSHPRSPRRTRLRLARRTEDQHEFFQRRQLQVLTRSRSAAGIHPHAIAVPCGADLKVWH